MIRYPVTEAALLSEIDKLAPKWRAAARRKTDGFRKAKTYAEKQGSWSAIKSVYVELQGGKCAYCERRFSTGEKSAIEHDVEHYRPKSAVGAWPPAGDSRTFKFPTGKASANGYYLLPYEPLNYIVACKRCNSAYKRDCFPIAGAVRKIHSADRAKLAAEKPLLLYPLCDIDDAPEDLITFVGMLPAPIAASGYKLQRAQVTIQFFDLAIREELLRERAELLKAVFVAFEDLGHRNPLRRRDARQTIAQLDNPKLKHRNCARSFYQLCLSSPVDASKHYEAAIGYLESVDG